MLGFGGKKGILPSKPFQEDGFYQKPLPLEPKQTNRFVVVGDSGAGIPFRTLIGKQLDKLLKTTPFQSILLVGDNVYGSAKGGIHKEDGDPKLFHDRISRGFSKFIKKGISCFPILGNHDVRYGKEMEQLAFWNVPRHYQFSRGNVDFFALDTTVMLPGYDSCYKERKDFAHQETQKQIEWLDEQLGKSNAKYKVVMGHYPMYCSGKYINRGINAELIRAILQPLLVKHQVDAYLCGHEHYYERSKPIYGVTHFLTGSSSKIAHDVEYLKTPPYPRATAQVVHQFMLFEETPKGLAFKTIDSNGKVIDSSILPPKTRIHTPHTEAHPPQKVGKILNFLRYATEFLHSPEALPKEPITPEKASGK
jgi:hypothetical protein